MIIMLASTIFIITTVSTSVGSFSLLRGMPPAQMKPWTLQPAISFWTLDSAVYFTFTLQQEHYNEHYIKHCSGHHIELLIEYYIEHHRAQCQQHKWGREHCDQLLHLHHSEHWTLISALKHRMIHQTLKIYNEYFCIIVWVTALFIPYFLNIAVNIGHYNQHWGMEVLVECFRHCRLDSLSYYFLFVHITQFAILNCAAQLHNTTIDMPVSIFVFVCVYIFVICICVCICVCMCMCIVWQCWH